MTLRIGNSAKKSEVRSQKSEKSVFCFLSSVVCFKRGFSFVELMAVVVILSLGILIVYEGYLVSLRGFDYCRNYLTVQPWIDQKLWDVCDRISHYNTLLAENMAGTFVIQKRRFNWSLNYNLLEQIKNKSLYKIELNVFWQEGVSRVNVRRGTYALYMEED